MTLVQAADVSNPEVQEVSDPHTAATDGFVHEVYGDALHADWEDWSWGTTFDYANSSQVHGGTASLAVTRTDPWSALQIGYRGDSLDISDYDTFSFWVHGGPTGGQEIEVMVDPPAGDGADPPVTQIITLQAKTWTQVTMPLASLTRKRVYRIVWFNNTDSSQPVYYLDDIRFTGPSKPPLALSVDASANQHPISPYIYGINFASEEVAKAVKLPVRRWGGNSTSRYNWKLDVHNTGMDWFFENIPEDNPTPELLPNGSIVDRFVDQNRATNTKSLLTIPLMGWTPKARVEAHPYDCGFPATRFPNQDSFDPWDEQCGNGVLQGEPIVGNDPLDTSQAIGPTFVKDWIKHLKSRYKSAKYGGVMFYNLDNEPMLWSDTHRDVHPEATSYDELRDRTITYAAAIKAVDPTAKTLGPALWGWTAYFWSALDWESGDDWYNHPQDRLNHGDVPFIEWYLQQMKAYQDQHGKRLLDYVDVHYYPQLNGVPLTQPGQPGNAEVQALRLRSTRSLWDRTYMDGSWIDQPVYLIPRMKEWVANNYPETNLAITEYNWGALDHINGALAQADILGIFGREGLDLATLWDAPKNATAPGILAFRLYRNYDGKGNGFGQTSVAATSNDQDRLSVYAAARTDGALTIIVINKTGQAIKSPVKLTGFNPKSSAAVYRYSTAKPNAIVRLTNQAVSATGFTSTFPANSIKLFVIPKLE